MLKSQPQDRIVVAVHTPKGLIACGSLRHNIAGFPTRDAWPVAHATSTFLEVFHA